MKYFLFAFSILFIFSCTDSQSEAEANRKADSTRHADSFANLEHQARIKKAEDSIAQVNARMNEMCPALKKYLELTDKQLSVLHSSKNLDVISQRYMVYKDSVMLEESRVIRQFTGMDSACKKIFYDRADLLIAELKAAMGQ